MAARLHQGSQGMGAQPGSSALKTFMLTALAMIAFAGNSLLCRLALRETSIDAASFTLIRIASGALMLILLVRVRMAWRARMRDRAAAQLSVSPAQVDLDPTRTGGRWIAGLALFFYAAGFSFAYRGLAAGSGALLLFGAVQVTMIGVGWWRGERLRLLQWWGLALALLGLTGLLLPGAAAPPTDAALLMLAAGVAWGVYSLSARGVTDPLHISAGNFLRALPLAVAASLIAWALGTPSTVLTGPWDLSGVLLALASGAIASGLGYAIWYMALPGMSAPIAATVQLSVPVITSIGGVLLLAEPPTLRLILASAAILGGIALVIQARR